MNPDSGYETLLKRVARNIQLARKKRKLSQEDMADLGFNYRHYQKIESGKHSVSLYTLYRVAKALRVDISEFLK